MYTIRKTFKFAAAHQLEEAVSACCTDTIHGHNYVVEVFLQALTLNKAGMVLDFSVVKGLMMKLLDEWDHALHLPKSILKKMGGLKRVRKTNKRLIIWSVNPTAENMARNIFTYLAKVLKGDDTPADAVRVQKVRVHETDSGYAEYTSFL